MFVCSLFLEGDNQKNEKKQQTNQQTNKQSKNLDKDSQALFPEKKTHEGTKFTPQDDECRVE